MTSKIPGSIRIVHLSDLHICEKNLHPKLKELFSYMSEKLGVQIHLPDNSDQILDRMITSINDLDPDIICITGDITTFGDKKSFEEAKRIIDRIRQSKIPGVNRKIITTPGNHDVLCSQFDLLLKQGGILANLAKHLLFNGAKARIENILKYIGHTYNKNALANYLEFKNNANISTGDHPAKIHGLQVRCVPFESVSMDPLWMNIGESTPAQFTNFRELLRQRNPDDSEVLIALIHHNPMSAAEVTEPRLINAYNSFPGASVYMKEMQMEGVDVILYGHQHVRSCCLVDFVPEIPGHLYLIGAPSTNTSNGSEARNSPGFNLIDVFDEYHGRLATFEVDPETHRIVDNHQPTDLVFERKRVNDLVTLCMRSEVRHYRHDGSDSGALWGNMFKPGAKKVFAVGPRAETLGERYRLDTFIEILKKQQESKVLILISDPELFDVVKTLPDDKKTKLSRIWGEKQSWENQAESAARVLRTLKDWWDELDDSFKSRVFIRASHTLLPFGAALRYEMTGDATAVVRLHPVGVMDDLAPAHFLLERRHNQASFTFFEKYFNQLWEKSRSIVLFPK